MSNELKALLKKIGKDKDFVTTAKDIPEPDYCTSGIMRIDKLVGGWPSGRTVTLYGREGAGKSTLAFCTIADAQRQGKTCLWVDCEHAYSKEWSQTLGVDIENLIVITNKSLERILDVIKKLHESGQELDVVVVDSISDMQTIKYFDDDSHQLGSQSKATKEFIAKTRYWFPNALIMCLSQETNAPVGGTQWGSIPTGGKNLKHESSTIVRFTYANSDRHAGEQKVGDKTIFRDTLYVDITWRFEKTRSGDVGARGQYRLYPGVGIDREHEVFVEGLHSGVIRKKGGYFYHGENTIQGGDNFINELKTNPVFFEEVYKDVLGAEERFEQLEPDGDSGPEGN